MYFDFYSVKDWVGTYPMSVKTVYKLHTTPDYRSDHRIIERDKYILFYTLEGVGQIQVDGVVMAATANTVIFARASHSLAYHCCSDIWNFWLFEFKTEPFLLRPNHIYSLPFKLAFFNLCDQILLSLKEGHQQLASAHFHVFYSLLVRELTPNSKPNYPMVIEKSLEYMKENMKNFTVESLSRFMNIPLRTLIYIFNKETGASPIQYFQRLRIESGKKCLETSDMSVAEIAQALGYCSSGHFSAVFKQLTGCSPLQYRRQFNLQNIG